jgi:hypothetical protein
MTSKEQALKDLISTIQEDPTASRWEELRQFCVNELVGYTICMNDEIRALTSIVTRNLLRPWCTCS